MSVTSTNYRPDIDGLRAIAILSVVFYHAGLGCPGGYVGVDVFFVISGYLITSLILKDIREERFSLVRFWERRLRRIFPALVATVLVTLVAGWFLLLPEHLEKLGQSTIAQALLSANFYFWRTDNYFGGGNEEKALLHTWSLAVEEQFYLFFPLILVFLFRRPEFRRPRVLVATLLAGLVVSLGVAVWGVKHQPYATFFLLPTRAWELTCGALVAVLPVAAIPMSRLVREGASWFGLLAIFLPVCLYNDNTPFPGLAALPSCFGTSLLIWANLPAVSADNRSLRTLSASLLSLRGVTFIGLISYSLYLWHWPVMAFSNYWKTAPFSLALRWSFVGLAFGLAVLSWRYIETPFREKTVCGTRRKIFGFGVAATTMSLLLGLGIVLKQGVPDRIPSEALAILRAAEKDSREKYENINFDKNISKADEVVDDKMSHLGSAPDTDPIQVMIWGDSHAGCAFPVFDSLCQQYGIAGRAVFVHSTPPLVSVDYHLRFGSKDAPAISSAVVDYVRINKIPNTFLLAYWSEYEQAGGSKKLESSLNATVQSLKTTGTKVWVILDWPDYDNDVTKTLVRKLIFPEIPWPVALRSKSDHRQRNLAMYDLAAHGSNAVYLDPAPFLENSAGKDFNLIADGVPLYCDNHHLSLRGSEIALFPLLQPVFEKEFRQAGLHGSHQDRLPTP